MTNIKNSSTSRCEALILRGFYLHVLILRGFYLHIFGRIHVYWEYVGSVTFFITHLNLTHLQEIRMWHILNVTHNLKAQVTVNLSTSIPLGRKWWVV